MSADGSAPIVLPLTGKVIRAADLFCGAGGTSTGARRAINQLGGTMKLVAVNHWQTAIDTHTRMHPEATHLCADLENVRPLQAIPGGVLDLLMASPTCTYYSRARGGKPVNDQQRMDPWHVVRWCTELRVHRLLVENVPEMMDWGPCNAQTGKPIPSRKGEYFRAWIAALQAIGFRVEYRVLCCADFGDPTTRERFFLMGRSDGKRLRWPEPSHAKTGGLDLLGMRPAWRSAAEIIDWTLLGSSIFRRKRQLVRKTLMRLYTGALRNDWPRQHCEALRALLDGTTPRLQVTTEEAAEIAERLGGALVMATGAGGVARSIEQPIPTATGGGKGGARPHFAYPIIAPYYGGGSGLTASSAEDPLDAVTTKARFGMARPFIIPITHTGERPAHSIDQPVKTITCANRGELALARPFLVPNFGERDGQDPRWHSIDEPPPTVCAQGHIQLAQPAIIGYEIDVLYRMLHWRELARAMSFDDEGEVYSFVGTASDITKQIGNAVPGRTAKALVRALLEQG